MEQIQFIVNAINTHIPQILTVCFLSFLAIAIASVFIKNKQEYETIVSDLYHERRKRTPLIKKAEKQYIGNYQEEEFEEIDEFEYYLEKEGYTVETHRDTIREKAAWEDISIEKERGLNQNIEKLLEYERLNKIIAKQTITKESSRNIGDEITKMIQERILMDMNYQRAQNKSLGVNSAQSYYKFKKLAEKGKLKGNHKTPYAKQLEKQVNKGKPKNHAQIEKQHSADKAQKAISF